jgi:hypothetical protein
MLPRCTYRGPQGMGSNAPRGHRECTRDVRGGFAARGSDVAWSSEGLRRDCFLWRSLVIQFHPASSPMSRARARSEAVGTEWWEWRRVGLSGVDVSCGGGCQDVRGPQACASPVGNPAALSHPMGPVARAPTSDAPMGSSVAI